MKNDSLALLKRTLEIRLFGLLKIPMVAYVRPTIVESSLERAVVKIPLARRNRNHLGGMYFGVLASGADLTAGYLTLSAIKQGGNKVNMVFKSVEAEFQKKVDGDALFICENGKAIAEAVEKAASSTERVDLPVEVVVKVEKNPADTYASFKMMLSLRARRPKG